MKHKSTLATLIGLTTHGHLVLPLVILILVLIASIMILAGQIKSGSATSDTGILQAAVEPSCQVALTVPLSKCNEPCQANADCNTGFCYLQRTVTGVCRIASRPTDLSCGPPTGTIAPKPTPTCVPRPSCLDTNPRCLVPEPINGWCPDTRPTDIPKPTCSQKPVCIKAPCEFPQPPGGWCGCRPRPACLDASPPCMIAMPLDGWCPTVTPIVLPPQPIPFPSWWNILPPRLKNFLELLYTNRFFFGRPTTMEKLLDDNMTPTPSY